MTEKEIQEILKELVVMCAHCFRSSYPIGNCDFTLGRYDCPFVERAVREIKEWLKEGK